MKGIILAGGSGTRLHPLTIGVSKQLLPVYDKPMIYYPISVLMLSDIKDILIISTPNDLPNFKKLLKSGKQFGLNINYASQKSPDGLAQAFIIGEKFIGKEDVCLILGDNIFYGSGFKDLLIESVKTVEKQKKAVIFGKYVQDPERYGVANIDKNGDVNKIEEKPKNPISNYAVVGLYFYPNSVINISKKITPSERGELEITSVNQKFLEHGNLKMKILSRGFAWFDTGTHDTLSESAIFVKSVEKSTGLKIACLEEIALILKYISKESLEDFDQYQPQGSYNSYVKKIFKSYNEDD